MSTQIVRVDVAAAPDSVPIRSDVANVLVVITAERKPIGLRRVPRPVDGVLRLKALIADAGRTDHAEPARDRAKGPRISIVIPTHERPADLRRCLEALTSARRDGHEVIVVDNFPQSRRTESVAIAFGVGYIVERTPGLNRARNAGVCAATNDIVAFVDDDVVVSDGWTASIADRFADPTVACATGLVLPIELETAAQEQFEDYCVQRRDFHPHVYSRDVLPASAAAVVGMGANMAFRRSVLVRLGLFDTRIGAGTSTRAADETDMFARVIDAGWRIVYTPDAYVWHRHRRTAREVRSCVFGYGVGIYSLLTKRLLEHGDVGAIVTAGRWFLGPLVKAVRAKAAGTPSAPWSVVLAELAGAPIGPFCWMYEAWRARARA